MTTKRLDELIHREFMRDPIDPTPESFYGAVWNRIRQEKNEISATGHDKFRTVSFGVMCWRLVPVFSLFMLITFICQWYYAADSNDRIFNSTESYVLDTGDAPSNDELLYQILFPSDNRVLEKNP